MRKGLLQLIYIKIDPRASQVLMYQKDRVFCVKVKPPANSNWDSELVQPMNEYLAGDLKEKIDVAFAHRKSTKLHSKNAQQKP